MIGCSAYRSSPGVRTLRSRVRFATPAHPTRVATHQPTRRVAQLEELCQRLCPLPRGAPRQPTEPTDQQEVLLPGQTLVQRGELAGERDAGPNRFGFANHVVAEDPGRASVGARQGGEDPQGGRLARPIWGSCDVSVGAMTW